MCILNYVKKHHHMIICTPNPTHPASFSRCLQQSVWEVVTQKASSFRQRFAVWPIRFQAHWIVADNSQWNEQAPGLRTNSINALTYSMIRIIGKVCLRGMQHAHSQRNWEAHKVPNKWKSLTWPLNCLSCKAKPPSFQKAFQKGTYRSWHER